MAETKTKPTGASVDAYLASRASPEQLTDCKAIMAMCKRVTKQQPKMWGPSIVGYGSYTYRYESGHSGDACLAGIDRKVADFWKTTQRYPNTPAGAADPYTPFVGPGRRSK
jgi:hypothetical protein